VADDLRQRFIEAIGACERPTMEDLAEVVMAVRDEELERLRRWERIASKDNTQLREEVTRLRINAEKDVCSGCMQREEQRDRWMEASRQIGVKYEAAKQRWYEQAERAEKAELVIARAENLRDKWLAWPAGDMHHAAGLMLSGYLDGTAYGSDEPRPVGLPDEDADRG
jgi:hypothetical protein